ncbi:MAG: NADH-ubiquinone oxidoreductase-F iron-sulfur binding region domain-containing protein, partial [Candidatus Contubernalis sp.]|nr:NADH-ubiquinone oxidoreductase-F iron-sulfur binding region domain-containing protein [Candidatus Contubernalis sp.]
TEDKIGEVVTNHLLNDKIDREFALGKIGEGELPAEYDDLPNFFVDLPFYEKQVRLCLRNCGFINPEIIDEYVERDGYQALRKVITEMKPEEVVELVKESGLRGRGGGGFSTGLKWQFTMAAKGDKKYVVCNADEGDPGAFMDRSILEGDPHSVMEGMAVAGYAVGADEGYVYCRAEYPLAVKRLKMAIQQAKDKNFLGENIMGTNFSFNLKVKEGAGAFVCGEETALLMSIEGKRGMPRPRPPFPANEGLFGKPTCLNNVETFANVPVVILDGPEKFASIGTEGSKGTKVFALTGSINRTGLAEVPMGITLKEVVFDIAGGIIDDGKFKAVQAGGPSGGCIPEDLLHLPIDYDSLTGAGAMMGSGGLVVMGEDTCMVDIARYFLTFTQSESCGKCTPCREGTKRMLEILQRIVAGKGEPDDIEKLKTLGEAIKDTSLCGLGQTAPNPVLTTLRYFQNEYERHIFDKRCTAGVCIDLMIYLIDSELCNGCGRCKKACPVGAISGEKKEVHTIDPETCIKCGACVEKCKQEAISLQS